MLNYHIGEVLKTWPQWVAVEGIIFYIFVYLKYFIIKNKIFGGGKNTQCIPTCLNLFKAILFNHSCIINNFANFQLL